MVPSPGIVPVAGEVIIVLWWLILLLRLRRSIVDVCSISFRCSIASDCCTEGQRSVWWSAEEHKPESGDRCRFLIQSQLGYQVNQGI